MIRTKSTEIAGSIPSRFTLKKRGNICKFDYYCCLHQLTKNRQLIHAKLEATGLVSERTWNPATSGLGSRMNTLITSNRPFTGVTGRVSWHYASVWGLRSETTKATYEMRNSPHDLRLALNWFKLAPGKRSNPGDTGAAERDQKTRRKLE